MTQKELEVINKAFEQGIYTKGGEFWYDEKNGLHYLSPEELHISIATFIAMYGGNFIEEYDQLCIHSMSWEDDEYVTKVSDYGETWWLKEDIDGEGK